MGIFPNIGTILQILGILVVFMAILADITEYQGKYPYIGGIIGNISIIPGILPLFN